MLEASKRNGGAQVELEEMLKHAQIELKQAQATKVGAVNEDTTTGHFGESIDKSGRRQPSVF